MITTTLLNAKDIKLIDGNFVYANDDVDIDINVSAFSLSIDNPLLNSPKINLELVLLDKYLCFTQKNNKIYVRNE